MKNKKEIGLEGKNFPSTIKFMEDRIMAKVNFKLNGKKYQLEFLPNSMVEVVQLDSKNKFLVPKGTKVRDLVNHLSLGV